MKNLEYMLWDQNYLDNYPVNFYADILNLDETLKGYNSKDIGEVIGGMIEIKQRLDRLNVDGLENKTEFSKDIKLKIGEVNNIIKGYIIKQEPTFVERIIEKFNVHWLGKYLNQDIIEKTIGGLK